MVSTLFYEERIKCRKHLGNKLTPSKESGNVDRSGLNGENKVPIWKDYKTRQQGFGRGPLRPPTPVAPRPPMVPNPNGGGMPSPMGNGMKSLTLPGPGPARGGRYNMYYPGTPTKPGLPAVPPAASSDWSAPGSWQHARNKAILKGVMRGLERAFFKASPVGRMLDIGFTLLDGAWSINNPGSPGKPAGYNFGDKGWTLACKDAGALQKIASPGPGTPNKNPYCNINSQVPNANYDGSWTVPANWNTVYIGPATFGGTRFNISEHWWRPLNRPRPAVRWDPAVPARRRVVTPAPDAVPQSVDDPYHDPDAGKKRRARMLPGPHAYGRARPKPGVRDQPNAPYLPPGKVPPGVVKVPSLPRPGEEKHVFKGTGIIGDIYGTLTEAKDALKCVEKNMKGHRIPKGAGLVGRLHAAAAYMGQHPSAVDWGGIGRCMVENHIEDKVIGKVNKLANRITGNPYWSRPVGVGSGSWAQRMS